MIKSELKSRTAVIIAAVLIAAALLNVSAVAENIEYSASYSYASGKYYSSLCEVELTGNQSEDIANVAKSQIGYHESSNGDLSGYGTGAGNYTEYGRWYGMQDDWCNIFVSWCAHVAGIPESILPKLTSATCSYQSVLPSVSAECFRYSAWCDVLPGDLIFSCTCGAGSSCIDHVGIVVDVDDSTIYTVEGNMSEMVKACEYPVSSGYQSRLDARINYIARPAYEDLRQPEALTDSVNTLCLGKSVYALFDTRLDFEQAVEFCESTGGRLAVVTDDMCSELSALTDGGMRKGYFVDGGEDGEFILCGGSLREYSNEKSIGFICEFVTDEILPVNTASFNNSKYEIYDVNMTYDEAKAFASEKGGRLAEIDSVYETRMLSLLLKNSEMYYIDGKVEDENAEVLLNNGEGDLSAATVHRNEGKTGFIVEYGSAEKKTVIYDANGGEGAPIEKVNEGSGFVTVSSIIPVRKNKEFLGWSVDAKSKTVDYKSGESFILTENTVLYAVWG